MPAVGFSSVVSDHTSMGTGALVTRGIEPGAFQRAQLRRHPTLNGPDLILVRLRSDIPRAVGLTGLRQDRRFRRPRPGGRARRWWAGQHRLGGRGAAPGGDRQLPEHRRHSSTSRGRPRRGRGDRAWPHPGDVGAEEAPRPGLAEALSGSPSGSWQPVGVAGVGRRGHRCCGRSARRDRAWGDGCGICSPSDLRRARRHGARRVGGRRRIGAWSSPTSWRHCRTQARPARPRRCAAIRVTAPATSVRGWESRLTVRRGRIATGPRRHRRRR